MHADKKDPRLSGMMTLVLCLTPTHAQKWISEELHLINLVSNGDFVMFGWSYEQKFRHKLETEIKYIASIALTIKFSSSLENA